MRRFQRLPFNSLIFSAINVFITKCTFQIPAGVWHEYEKKDNSYFFNQSSTPESSVMHLKLRSFIISVVGLHWQALRVSGKDGSKEEY